MPVVEGCVNGVDSRPVPLNGDGAWLGNVRSTELKNWGRCCREPVVNELDRGVRSVVGVECMSSQIVDEGGDVGNVSFR